jgi:hypothetical protein
MVRQPLQNILQLIVCSFVYIQLASLLGCNAEEIALSMPAEYVTKLLRQPPSIYIPHNAISQPS